jgi:hypothetical protein
VKAAALAERNYDVVVAIAQQNLDLGERLFTVSVLGGGLPTDPGAELVATRLADGVTADPYSQSDFDTDKSTAETAKQQALTTAGKTYATAHAAAAGTRQQAIATAKSAFATSQTTADQTLVDTRGAETETYVHAAADREKLRAENSATLQADHDKQAAASRASKTSELNTSNGTHFATLFSSFASAGSDFMGVAVDAVKGLKTDFAEHDRVYTRAEATEDKSLASSLLGAANTLTTSVTSALTTHDDCIKRWLRRGVFLGTQCSMRLSSVCRRDFPSKCLA